MRARQFLGWFADLPYGDPDRPTLRRRILTTLVLVLAFRLLALVPVFNVEEENLHALLADNPLLAALDLLAGGDVLTSFSLVGAGILPYLLALSLVKTATRLIPWLRAFEAKGESGKKRLDLLTKIITLPLAFALAWGLTHTFVKETGFFPEKIHWFTASRFLSTFGVVGVMTLGSLVTMGITTLITNKGVGAGESVILIFGACVGMIEVVLETILDSPDAMSTTRQLALRALVAAIVAAVSYYLIKNQRRIPLRHANHPESKSNFLPLLPNHGGVLPMTSAVGLLALLIYARSFLASHFAGHFEGLQRGLALLTDPARAPYWALVAILVVLLVYAHNFAVLWKPSASSDVTLARQLAREGFFVVGLRPGAQTEAFLSREITRCSLLGAGLLVLIGAVLPYAVIRLAGQNLFVMVLAVFVFVQTVEKLRPEIEVHKGEHEYDNLLKRGKIRRS